MVADGNKYPLIQTTRGEEVVYELDQIDADLTQTIYTDGGWHNDDDLDPDDITANQNVFIQTVIATANQLLDTHPKLKNFLISWQSHMAFHFSYSQEDLRKEIDDLERTKGDQIKSYCETNDCERYLSDALAQLERAKPTPPTSFYGPDEYPSDNNNDNNNDEWVPENVKREMHNKIESDGKRQRKK